MSEHGSCWCECCLREHLAEEGLSWPWSRGPCFAQRPLWVELHSVGMRQPEDLASLHVVPPLGDGREYGRKGNPVPGPGGALKQGKGLRQGFTSESAVCFLRPLCPALHPKAGGSLTYPFADPCPPTPGTELLRTCTFEN